MIDLDSPDTDPAVVEAGLDFLSKVTKIARPGQKYDVIEMYRKRIPVKRSCIHDHFYVEVECLVLSDGTGLLTGMSMATLEEAKRTECEECYIKGYFNYSEMHGFPVFQGTIAQIRYANKIRAKAHKRHGDLIRKAVDYHIIMFQTISVGS